LGQIVVRSPVNDRTFLILGGAGLVGFQVAHRVAADLAPDRIVIASLDTAGVDRAVAGLRELVGDGIEIVGEVGDVFSREDMAQTSRRALLADREARAAVFEDLLGPIDAAYARSRLAHLIERYRPDVVVDAINTATAISYQDVYTAAVLAERTICDLRSGSDHDPERIAHDVETVILSLPLPQLIRHSVILYRALRSVGTRLYLKVGTTGTGGMGLNIPFTHSEDRPSVQLLTKTAVAFAHTGLLFLMARSPGGLAVKEIKPGALIGYSDVAHRTIRERGETVWVYEPQRQSLGATLRLRVPAGGFARRSDLQVPVVDTGENGVFTKGEFEVITAPGQMEFVTPEEIARLCVLEISGGNTGRDVVAGLDASVLMPSYRGGVLRSRVIDQLRDLEERSGTRSVALGQLGPPELGKLLWEVELIALVYGTFPAALATPPAEMSAAAARLLEERTELAATITSVGYPILAPDGASLLRGPTIRIPEVAGTDEIPLDAPRRDAWAAKGWVDLRPDNFARWQDRLRSVRDTRPGKVQPGSAGVTDVSHEDRIDCGAVVAHLVATELGGYRIK
jgi:hypothetical protein